MFLELLVRLRQQLAQLVLQALIHRLVQWVAGRVCLDFSVLVVQTLFHALWGQSLQLWAPRPYPRAYHVVQGHSLQQVHLCAWYAFLDFTALETPTRLDVRKVLILWQFKPQRSQHATYAVRGRSQRPV
jgi:hypothetical protein